MPHTRLRAIATMLVAVMAFSCMDAILKLFSTRYPPTEVAVLRGLASMPFLLGPLWVRGRLHELRPKRWPMHLLRGLLNTCLVAGFVYSVRVLSLGSAYAIFLVAPLLVTALSMPLLGERVPGRNWVAIVVGMIGVMTMLRPSASSLVTVGALAAFGAAVAYALNVIALRVITRTDTTSSVVFWTLALMTSLCALIAVPHWVPVQPDAYKWLLALGCSGAIGQHLLTEAFRQAPPAVVAPFEYTALPWGVAIDLVFWHTLPDQSMLLGGGIVIASGLYLIWREHRDAWMTRTG